MIHWASHIHRRLILEHSGKWSLSCENYFGNAVSRSTLWQFILGRNSEQISSGSCNYRYRTKYFIFLFFCELIWKMLESHRKKNRSGSVIQWSGSGSVTQYGSGTLVTVLATKTLSPHCFKRLPILGIKIIWTCLFLLDLDCIKRYIVHTVQIHFLSINLLNFIFV